MQKTRPSAATLTGAAKFGYGVALPVLTLVIYQVLLGVSLDSSGSWDGMGLVVAMILSIPGMLVANCWVPMHSWATRRKVLVAGLALPALLALTEFLWLYGGPARRIINAAFVAPFIWVWLFVALLYLPLAASIVVVLRHKYKAGTTST